MRFSDLKPLLEGKLLATKGEDHQITSLLIDSRKISSAQGAVFFAIKGKQHDGHKYLKDLYALGIRLFVVEDNVSIDEISDANVIKVSSAIRALQIVAAYHRSQFNIPVIGITGSNGKTIIKEWLFQLISPDYSVVKNPGSYNSQVGVPLSVWNIQDHHQIGIFEAGISTIGEMKNLQKIIQPTIGIFTNIGTAHNEGFKSISEKIQEKLSLFKDSSILIYRKDNPLVAEQINALPITKLSWGFCEDADVVIERNNEEYIIKPIDQSPFNISLPFSDQASIENGLHCVVVMLHLKIESTVIQQRIKNLRSVAMRLELKEGTNHCYLIDDSYNNDLAGLQISLDFLKHQKQKRKKRVILSDILQSGLTNREMAEGIAELINTSKIDFFVGVGKNLFNHQELFRIPATFFGTTNDFIKSKHLESYQEEVILIKGARYFQFERIARLLQYKVHGTIMEVDLGALAYNLNYFRAKLLPQTKLMVMVKAFAYGSGSIEVANVLNYHKVDYLGVAYADEGVDLRKNNIKTPIMIMNPTADSFEVMLAYNLEPEIYSFKILKQFIQYLNGKSATIHIKLDTGMHRLGFEEQDLDELIETLLDAENIRVASIFSHLAGSDEAQHDNFSREQAALFLKQAKRISDVIGYRPLFHILNSPGILRLPEFQMDMVRLGIGLYGVDPTELGARLRTVATLKTIVSQIKQIGKGETIGYGRRGKAEKNMKIATIAIGYADGFNRAFSNGAGKVSVNGSLAAVIGNVCMDMTMIDVTEIDVKEGDEVIVFGEARPIYEVAESINTIPYEILTNTSERVKRVFVAESI